jgi:hypothetical protein
MRSFVHARHSNLVVVGRLHLRLRMNVLMRTVSNPIAATPAFAMRRS